MSKIEEALRRARTERAENDPKGTPATAPRRTVEARTREPLRGDLVGLTAADEIARMKEEEVRDRTDLAARRIIDKDMRDVRVSDAFRQLRTRLFQRTAGKGCVVMVTSVTSGGGASFVSLNLGAAIAFDDSKTALLIDCNLQAPTLDDLILGGNVAAGLTDFLAGRETDVENIIHPIGLPRLRLVPAGGQSPSAMEYFTAPQLGQLMRQLRQRYRERTIILDAPPITEAADARILSELCDYVLLVVPYGRVTAAQVAHAAAAIGQEKLIGCVLNNEVRMPLLPGSSARESSWH